MVTTIYWSNPTATLHAGDARDVLAAMPDGSADCIVTSPPYWAKRNYGVAGQYGCETDPAGYVATLRAAFSEVRRVLAGDGTCWLDLGDSYSAGSATPSGKHAYIGPGTDGPERTWHGDQEPARLALAGRSRPPGGRMDHPERDRLAQANAMPESVRDRLNCRYELVFLLVKSRHYWFDLDPIRVPLATRPPARCRPGRAGGNGARPPAGAPAGRRRPGGTHPPKYGSHSRQVVAARRYGLGGGYAAHPRGRNPGDVWSIATRPYRGPHFAAYPIELPTRCIKAGCKPGGMVLDPFCGTGTTGIAALTLGRRFTGIELNPAFAALAAERLRQAVQPEPDGTEGGRP